MRLLKLIFWFLLITGCGMLCSCDENWKLLPQSVLQGPPQPELPPAVKSEQIIVGENNRYNNYSENITLVEKAKQLSDKCDKMTQELQQEQKINQQLKEENILLKTETAALKKELNQTNELLINTRVELDEWKSETARFHDEIRFIEKSQLEAIYRILKQLGGKEPDSEELGLTDNNKSRNKPAMTEAKHEAQN